MSLRDLVGGYRISEAILVAATLGLGDLLAGGARAIIGRPPHWRGDPRLRLRRLRDAHGDGPAVIEGVAA